MAPGNNASGGKRKRAQTRKGNVYVRRVMTEAGWSVGRTKNSYLGERYRRWAKLRGPKYAAVATGHEILCIVYYLMTRKTQYVDLGLTYLEERDRAAKQRRAIHDLEQLGLHVTVTAA